MQPIISGNPPVTTATTTTTTKTATSTTTVATTTTVSGTKTTSTAGPTPTSGSGICAGIATYDAAKAYNGEEKVVYKGGLYKAQWWTQGETPTTEGPTWNSWSYVGAC